MLTHGVLLASYHAQAGFPNRDFFTLAMHTEPQGTIAEQYVHSSMYTVNKATLHPCADPCVASQAACSGGGRRGDLCAASAWKMEDRNHFQSLARGNAAQHGQQHTLLDSSSCGL